MTRYLFVGLLVLLFLLSGLLWLGHSAPIDPLAEPWKNELLIEKRFKSPYDFNAFQELRAGKPVNCSWLMYRTRRRAGDIRVRPAMSRQIAHGEKGWWGISHPSIQAGAMGFYTLPPWTRPLGHVIYFLTKNRIIHASSSAGKVVEVPVTKYWASPSRIRTPSTK